MITLLIGENSFEIEKCLSAIESDFNGRIEKIDGSELKLAQLPDILMGISLFATERLVVIKNLGDNKIIWPVFGDWLNNISSDIHLVIIEPKPDKRTSTFKSLKKSATIKEFNLWSERDFLTAEKWVVSEAKELNLELDKNTAKLLVQRVGVDQWQLYNAINKLSLVDEISDDVIEDIIEASPMENIFDLLSSALCGDIIKLKRMLRVLEQSEDVYKLSALLFSQVFQLAAIVSSSNSDNVSRDFGIHPYVVSKLEPIAKRMGETGVSKAIMFFAEADDNMKLSDIEPWLLLERALIKVASI